FCRGAVAVLRRAERHNGYPAAGCGSCGAVLGLQRLRWHHQSEDRRELESGEFHHGEWYLRHLFPRSPPFRAGGPLEGGVRATVLRSVVSDRHIGGLYARGRQSEAQPREGGHVHLRRQIRAEPGDTTERRFLRYRL